MSTVLSSHPYSILAPNMRPPPSPSPSPCHLPPPPPPVMKVGRGGKLLAEAGPGVWGEMELGGRGRGKREGGEGGRGGGERRVELGEGGIVWGGCGGDMRH